MDSFAQIKRRAFSLGVVSLVFAFAAGCAVQHAYLVPAPTANLTNGGQSVTASAEGVSVTVTPNAWNGRPRNLYKRITPLEVRIENHSKRPVRLAYTDFTLQSPQGKTFAALPASEIRGRQYGENWAAPGPHFVDVAWRGPAYDHDHFDGGEGTEISPEFDWDDFYYAPYWGYGYVGMGPWPYAWSAPFGYYSAYYPYMRAIHLPTRSMLRKGIPEGVIAPGGYVQGFLYFEKVTPGLTSVDFVAKLQAAHSGAQFGMIKIPFVVKTKSTD